jgi:hypothetical protein
MAKKSLLHFGVRNNNCPKEKNRVRLMFDVAHATLGFLPGKAKEHEHVEGRNRTGEVKKGMQV